MKNTHKLVVVSVLGLSSVPAMAALCVEGDTGDSPTLTCTATDSGIIDDDRNNLSVTVESDAQIVRAEGRPVQLGGSNQSVNNLGLIESGNDDAIRGKGANLKVDNSGTIRGGDRGIRLQDNADNFTLINQESGEILARRQAVRLDNGDALENAQVTNHGLIQSTDGRAIQSRGPGGTVINHGSLLGGEEVVEAREDFTIENHGTIGLKGLSWDAGSQTGTNAGATDDEDGLQFASGSVDNHGVILGTDDGIDIDEGRVHNHDTGVIVSTGSESNPMDGGSGIDVDGMFEPTVGDDRAAGALTIVNEGYIEGVRAIGTDETSTSGITIENSGTLRGRSGTAIELADGQGDSSLLLNGNSEIFGDVIFGGGDDTLTVDGLSSTSGPLSDGIFDGGAGDNSVFFNDHVVSDLLSFEVIDDLIDLSFGSPDSNGISGQFRNFSTWIFSNEDSFTTAQLENRFMSASPVPTPATLPLLALGLAGIWASRASSRS